MLQFKLPFVIKISVLSLYEWLDYSGFTVLKITMFDGPFVEVILNFISQDAWYP